MSRKGQLLLVSWFLILAAANACAQESAWWDKKNEVGFGVGRDLTSGHNIKSPPLPPPFMDNRVNIGRGLTFQGNYGRRLRASELVAFTFEVPVVYLHNQKLLSSNDLVPASYTGLFVTPGLRANLFPNTLVSPWASFGGGFARFSTSKNGVFNVLKTPGDKNTTSAIEFGVGLDVKVWHMLKVRAEIRDFYAGVPNLNVDQGRTRMHNVVGGGGVVWTF
jgi:hypothetical protein